MFSPTAITAGRYIFDLLSGLFKKRSQRIYEFINELILIYLFLLNNFGFWRFVILYLSQYYVRLEFHRYPLIQVKRIYKYPFNTRISPI